MRQMIIPKTTRLVLFANQQSAAKRPFQFTVEGATKAIEKIQEISYRRGQQVREQRFLANEINSPMVMFGLWEVQALKYLVSVMEDFICHLG